MERIISLLCLDSLDCNDPRLDLGINFGSGTQNY